MRSEQIGKRIRQARKSAKLTQQALADRVGVTRSLVSQWENGVVQKAGAGNLEAAARELHVSVSYLLKGDAPSVAEDASTYTKKSFGDLARYWDMLTEHQRHELIGVAQKYAEENLAILEAFGVRRPAD